MSNELVTAYRFDASGYYIGAEKVQKGIMPKDDTLSMPELKDGYWAKWNGTAWELIKKPTTASECVGLSVKHDDNTAHGIELRNLFETLAKADSEHYRVTKDDELTESVEAIPASKPKTVDELKAEKTTKISETFEKLQSYNCTECYVTSSLGFQINADACSATNIEALIDMLPDDATTTSFKLYDNTFRALNKPQLKTMLMECKKNGLALYQQKFALLKAVSTATTADDVNAINVVFTMSDYSTSAN